MMITVTHGDGCRGRGQSDASSVADDIFYAVLAFFEPKSLCRFLFSFIFNAANQIMKLNHTLL